MSWAANRRPRGAAPTTRIRVGDGYVLEHGAGHHRLALVLDAEGRVRDLVAVTGADEWYVADSSKVPGPRGRPRKVTT